MSRTVRLDAPVAAGVLFDYLADTRRRPEWQSSLRTVCDVRGDGDVDTTWTDVTAVGARPQLRVTVYERPRVWAERGRWRGLSASLRIDFLEYAATRTRLIATYAISGTGLFAPIAAVLERFAGSAIRADLRQAVRLAGES